MAATPPVRSESELRSRAKKMALDRAKKARVPAEIRGFGDKRTLLRGSPEVPPGLKLAPSPDSAMPILGHLRSFQLRPGEARLRDLLRYREELGDIVRFQFGGITAHLMASPDHIQRALQEQNKLYGKNTRGMHKLRLILGTGLLTNDGESWLSQRRIAQPAFHRRRIASFGDDFAIATEEMTAQWTQGEPIDIHYEMMKVTLRIVGQTLLGTDVTKESDAIGAAVSTVVEDVNQRVNALVDLPPPFPTRRNKKLAIAMDVLDGIVLDMIEQRRRSGVSGDDLLGMLMDAQDEETGESMDDAQLRDEVMTIFLAGHETTANALTWTLYQLSKSPTIARRMQAEVDEVLGDRQASAADAKALTYTKQVLQESMRLHPPAWMLARSPDEDDVVDGYHIPRHSLVFLCPWVTHRHPAHWEDPEGFDPDRFSPERSKGRHRFAYFPFGGGPRLCIGSNFALMEAQLILATIARDWRLDLVPSHPVELEPLVTLRPKHGIAMVPHRR